MSVSRFQHFKDASMYESQGVKYCEPMTAKEIESEEEQDKCLNSPDFYVEEKFDGNRGTLHFFDRNTSIEETLSCDSLKTIPTVLATFLLNFRKEEVYNIYYQGCLEEDITTQDRLQSLLALFSSESEYTSANGIRFYVTDKCIKVAGKNFDPVFILWGLIDYFYKQMFMSGALYPSDGYARCFSRRVSVKTGWFVENTDSVPQLRDINIPELAGTVIDGEMFIPNRPFKDVSSTLNCTWDKAVKRQKELGNIVFHAFDILYYKGIRVEMMPLWRRKELLQRVVDLINSPCVKMVKYYRCDSKIRVYASEELKASIPSISHIYPNLAKELPKSCDLSPRAYYEYIVATGGEGVIVKPVDGKYYHKRGREYQKIKKFLTREVIIMGFTEPTKEYNGKFPKDRWEFWITPNGIRCDRTKVLNSSAKLLKKQGYIPVSKFWYEDLIGNIRYGVIISDEEIKSLPKNKKFVIENVYVDDHIVKVLEVGECSGFDEEQRKYFSCNALDYDGCPLRCSSNEIEKNGFDYVGWEGTVIEVKANELYTDTGKMRHPRFLRLRPDKNPFECTWSNHIQ